MNSRKILKEKFLTPTDLVSIISSELHNLTFTELQSLIIMSEIEIELRQDDNE